MNLPILKEQTLVETDIKGYPLTLRRMTFEDTDALVKYRSVDHSNIEVNLWMIALLMTGYTENLETRLKWLKSIQMDNIAEDLQETDRILALVGVGVESKKK